MRRLIALACAGVLLTACAHSAQQAKPRDYLISGWKALNVASIAAGTSVIAGLHGSEAATAAKGLRATHSALETATAAYEAINGPDADIDGTARLAEDRLDGALADLDAAAGR